MLNVEDPLVPVPVDLESYVNDAISAGSDRDVVSLMADYFREIAVRMPCFDSVGTPLIPPDAHVLDHFARAWDLADPEVAVNRPSAGTVACPVEEIECELCDERARYEGLVDDRGDQFLAYLCLDCMRRHGDQNLGAGASVYLMYFDEVPLAVRRVCDAIRASQGKGSIWADEATDDEETRASLYARLIGLQRVVREELEAVRADADHMVTKFKVDDNGNFERKRSEYDRYRGLVARAKRLKEALDMANGIPDPEDIAAPTQRNGEPPNELPTNPAKEATTPPSLPDPQAISARLRSLWVRTIGPLLDGHQHDLAHEWQNCVVRRLGSKLVVSGPVNFGNGDPFDGSLGGRIRSAIVEESSGMVTDLSYEFTDRALPKLRRVKTSSSDIFHPEDDPTVDLATVAESLIPHLSGTREEARLVISRLCVAGSSRFRLLLAAASEADRKAIGSTPGAASALHLAVGKVQRSEPLFNIVVDPEARTRYPRLTL